MYTVNMKSNRRTTILVITVITAVVVLAAAFASSHPDGLEWVAEKLGFVSRAIEEPVVAPPLPDYSLGLIKPPFWSTAVAGLIGAIVVFVFVFLIGKLMKRK